MKNSSRTVRKTIGRDVPPYYPNFGGGGIIYTYASKIQMGVVIRGKGSFVIFYSHK